MNDELHTCYCLVPHPEKPAFMITRQDGEWGLPAVRSEGTWNRKYIHEITEPIEDMLGLRTTALRRLADGRDWVMYELEVQSRSASRKVEARWYGRAQHESKGRLGEGTDRVLMDWLEQAEHPVPGALRRPWERRGWFAEATAWIDSKLAGMGARRTGPTRQLSLTGFGTVLETPTGKGRIVFKASEGGGVVESQVNELFFRASGGRAVPVLAADLERNWFLMPNFSERGFSTLPENRYAEAAGLFARILLKDELNRTKLGRLGLADFGLAELRRFSSAFAETGEPLRKGHGALTPDEFERLERKVRELGERCAALSEFDIPETLVNLDFRVGNIMAGERGILFLDWLEAAVSHPFFTVLNMLNSLRGGRLTSNANERDADDGLHAGIREKFLEPFEAMESKERLSMAFSLASEVFPLVNLKRWLGNIANLEPGSFWASSFDAQLKGWARGLLGS